jgi:hypothetical protein
MLLLRDDRRGKLSLSPRQKEAGDKEQIKLDESLNFSRQMKK